MKLVGATNWFVRGPFMLEGLLCGLGGLAARGLLPRHSARRSRCRRSSAAPVGRRRRARAGVPAHGADPARHGPRPRRARLRPHDPPLPARSERPGRRPRRRRDQPARQAASSASRTSRPACRSCSRRRGSATSSPATSPSSGRARARARVEQQLGRADRIENVLEALLVERGARSAVRAARRSRSRRLEGRVDLRDLLTYTIDPDTAKDFDDALSFRREPDGIRAWVHIADVSYFVGAGTPLDHGAARARVLDVRPGAVAPMLPHELADDLCSLRPRPGPALRHRRDPAERRAALLPLGDPLRRAAHLRPGGAARGAGRRSSRRST